MTDTHAHYMKQAIELAKRGGGWVNPNPQVGCVLVRNGAVIGEGWHTRFGAPHAEREALADCALRGDDARGATAYVTLEPCSHTGKTPPCVDALIEAGVERVVVGSADPNPQVAGKGIARLRDAGIAVEGGICEPECIALNEPFFHFITTGLPLVIAKYAMTLDGKIATRTGTSQWITGPEARAYVHDCRARYAAIMVGVNTVLADDPLLTARPVEDAACQAGNAEHPADEQAQPHQPLRVVVDSRLRTPLESQLVQTAATYPTLIFTCETDTARFEPYLEQGCQFCTVAEGPNGHVHLPAVIKELGQRDVDSVMVEGGPTLLGALFDERLVNKVQVYVAPKIFGGADAPSAVSGLGVALPAQAAQLVQVSVKSLGADMLFEGNVVYDDSSQH